MRHPILCSTRPICTILFCFVFLFAALPAGAAEEEKAPESSASKPTATVSADILSQYVFRGLSVSKDSAVIQPSLAASYEGFAVSIWGNLDTRQRTNNPLLAVPVGFVKNDSQGRWNETDITLSYTREIFKNFSVTGGNVYYSLSYARFDTNELFGGFSYAFPWVTVGFTTYKEVSHTPGWWMQLDITKSIPLPCHDMSLDLGASFGYMIMNDDDTTLNQLGTLGSYSEFHSGTLTAALKIPVTKYLTVAPKFGVSFPLTGASSDFIKANSWDSQDVHPYGGINLTATF